MILGEGLSLALFGAAAGVLGSVAAARLMTSLVFGVSTLDPITYAVAVCVLAVVASVACYIPARRAANVDPMIALRCE